ncbi:polymer-forming cytoskeletal protein [[Clostridium] cellulosi]
MKRHNSGSTLIMVAVMSAVASILAAALITLLLTANIVSEKNLNAQQAYFTARSAVDAVIAKLNDKNDASFREYVASLQDDKDYTSEMGTMSGGGNYEITLRKSGKKLKVTGRGYYPAYGASHTAVGTVNVNLAAPEDTPTLSPLHNIIYITGSQGLFIGTANITGDIVYPGSLNISSGTVIDGNVYVGGNLNVSNGARIEKNAYVSGDLSMAGHYIGGDAYCLGNVFFAGESRQIRGTLYYKGYAETANNNLSFFAPSSVKKPDLSFDMPFTSAKADTNLPDKVSAEVHANPIMITHSTALINKSGTIVSCDNYSDANRPVIIDTSDGDIYLLVNRSTTLMNRQFYVKGPNHLYIYLEGNGTTLTLTGGLPVIRMYDKNEEPKIFVIGGSGTRLELQSAEIDGVIYMPDGSIDMSGGVSDNGVQTGYAVAGSIVANRAYIDSNLKLKFVEMNLDGTPLSVLSGKAQGTDPWQIESWS